MKTALVVDDDVGTLEGFSRILTSQGFQTTITTSVAEAFNYASTCRFTVILADLRLPDQSGIEFLTSLRNKAVWTPFVMVTGFGTVSDAVRALKLGATDFLEKPVFEEDLVAAVRRAIIMAETPQTSTAASQQDPYGALCSDERIGEVLQLIGVSPSRWSAKELAARVGLSESRLCHIFRHTKGISLRRFVREQQLLAAAKLLRLTHHRVSEIAYETGFESPSHFDKRFRAHFGASPTAYRRVHRCPHENCVP